MNVPEQLYREILRIPDSRGLLSVIHLHDEVPFDVKRVFFLSEIPSNAIRGGHGHFKCEQYLFSLAGSCTLKISSKLEEVQIELSVATGAVLVNPGLYLELSEFTTGSVVGVFASEYYDSNDYFYVNPFKAGG
jgi:hypothetical protein